MLSRCFQSQSAADACYGLAMLPVWTSSTTSSWKTWTLDSVAAQHPYMYRRHLLGHQLCKLVRKLLQPHALLLILFALPFAVPAGPRQLVRHHRCHRMRRSHAPDVRAVHGCVLLPGTVEMGTRPELGGFVTSSAPSAAAPEVRPWETGRRQTGRCCYTAAVESRGKLDRLTAV